MISSVTLILKLEPLDVERTGCLCLGPTSLISFCRGDILADFMRWQLWKRAHGATWLRQFYVSVRKVAKAVSAVLRVGG